MLANLRLPDRKAAFLGLIIGATFLFEAFNYSTTEHALGDLMGGLQFLGVAWSTILALAFCVIDFAGIARLFTPEDRPADSRLEGIYLLAAWMLAGVINATTTWWAMSVALLRQASLGNELVSREEFLLYVPILVAGAVWLIRILLIGSLTMAGSKHAVRAPQPAAEKPSIPPAVPSPRMQTAALVRPFTGGRS
jgi:hypothetical protein